jgi:hypothetical protein
MPGESIAPISTRFLPRSYGHPQIFLSMPEKM